MLKPNGGITVGGELDLLHGQMSMRHPAGLTGGFQIYLIISETFIAVIWFDSYVICLALYI